MYEKYNNGCSCGLISKWRRLVGCAALIHICKLVEPLLNYYPCLPIWYTTPSVAWCMYLCLVLRVDSIIKRPISWWYGRSWRLSFHYEGGILYRVWELESIDICMEPFILSLLIHIVVLLLVNLSGYLAAMEDVHADILHLFFIWSFCIKNISQSFLLLLYLFSTPNTKLTVKEYVRA